MASVLRTFRDNTLVRIDVNGGAHENPDGTVAPKSHIHIYNVYSAYILFLDYNNLQEFE
ncbi:DUF6978 family protein [Staphylococcus delphini]|uniref:DUF6978 family protein n=1 Tax=Staphylococcus delphini TaxID=53344 RepID=UPI0039C9FA14